MNSLKGAARAVNITAGWRDLTTLVYKGASYNNNDIPGSENFRQYFKKNSKGLSC